MGSAEAALSGASRNKFLTRYVQLDQALLALDPAANSKDHRPIFLHDDGKGILISLASETLEQLFIARIAAG